MSLDVYLSLSESPQAREHMPRKSIFVREDGRTVKITREEWDQRYPGRTPFVVKDEDQCQYHDNITHNLGAMASWAGLYNPLWRPKGSGITRASQLIEPLTRGLEILRGDPDKFRTFNPINGWGNYEGLVRFTADYLAACVRMPTAEVRISR